MEAAVCLVVVFTRCFCMSTSYPRLWLLIWSKCGVLHSSDVALFPITCRVLANLAVTAVVGLVPICSGLGPEVFQVRLCCPILSLTDRLRGTDRPTSAGDRPILTPAPPRIMCTALRVFFPLDPKLSGGLPQLSCCCSGVFCGPVSQGLFSLEW